MVEVVGAQSGILAFDNSIQIYILCWAPEHLMRLLLCENHKTSGSNLYFIRRWVPESAVWFLTTCTTSTKFIWHLKITVFIYTSRNLSIYSYTLIWHLEIYCIYSHHRIYLVSDDILHLILHDKFVISKMIALTNHSPDG